MRVVTSAPPKRYAALRWAATVLFAALGVLLAPLTLAAFASVNPAASDALRFLSTGEAFLATKLKLATLDPYWRGLAYLLAASACVWVSAYVKPRPV